MNKEIKILLVEDNEGDIVLTEQALKKAHMATEFNVARDGDQALKYLRKTGEFQDAETPDLIFLDINLPGINGMEVLKEIKKDQILKTIPVVMLTTSESGEDIIESYRNYANCYIVKPVDFKKFMDVVQKIKDFWISIVKLPTQLN